MLSLEQVLGYLEQQVPPQLAAGWDNVGLLLGDSTAQVRRIMTCLTVTPESACEAIAASANLIITHHPILFRGVKRLTTETPDGKMILALARASVAVYSPHTALDNAANGINQQLARYLDLEEITPLRRAQQAREYKIVVFVPESDLAGVSAGLFAAGAGVIGQYSECSFRLPGTGTFFGSEGSNPAVGRKGRQEEVSEWRLEVVCPETSLGEAIAAMRRAHSYEEPAFDVYPLEPRFSALGEGRIGRLPERVRLDDLALRLKTALKTPRVQVVGEADRLVERVAIVCGAGGDFLADALRCRADVLLTGELRFHDYLTALTQGIALLLPGHYATERFGLEELATRLGRQFPELEVWASKHERDPVRSL